MPKPIRLSHIVPMTRQYQAMIDWYCNVFEAKVVHGNPALTFITFDDESHRFAFADLDVLRPVGDGQRGDIGVNHVAFTYESAGDLLDTYERLSALGIEPYWPIHHGITLSLYYQDPDGNRLELQVEALDNQAAFDFMASDTFIANPVGVLYDPKALAAARHAGADEASLLKLPEGTQSPIPAEHGLAA
jgi:catechol 2,3-dioxygenase-like lactoylglutathione lyase family enzyme